MQVQPISNKPSLIPKADGHGRLVVTARLGDTVVEGRAVSVQYSLNDDLGLIWETSNAFPTGAPFDMFGVTLSAGETGDIVPVAIYGQVDGVTLPAAVTGNAGLLRGGTRSAALNTVITGALNNQNGMVVAEITDAKTGSQNQRDLFLFGKHLILETLLRSTGRVKDNKGPISQSMLMDGYGNGFLMVDASEGLEGGRLTLCRRGRTTSWKATYDGGNLGEAVNDGVFIYGVPVVDVAGTAGATGRVQVLGEYKEADLGAAVNVTGANNALLYTSGNNTIAAGELPVRRAFAAVESGNLRTRDIHLLGRVFNN